MSDTCSNDGPAMQYIPDGTLLQFFEAVIVLTSHACNAVREQVNLISHWVTVSANACQ